MVRPEEEKTLEDYRIAEEIGKQHLAKFDTLDFEVFSHQEWSRLHESHSHEVIVHWPDGRKTEGIDAHIDDMSKMFIHAPNTRITAHPIKLYTDDWTSVVGVIEGTFTKPMPTPDGRSIPPTGKSFKLMMVTVGHWKDGVMDEEYLFWDNAAYAKQIGLG